MRPTNPVISISSNVLLDSGMIYQVIQLVNILLGELTESQFVRIVIRVGNIALRHFESRLCIETISVLERLICVPTGSSNRQHFDMSSCMKALTIAFCYGSHAKDSQAYLDRAEARGHYSMLIG